MQSKNASTVWDYLIQVMHQNAENPPADATPAQRIHGQGLVQQMLNSGWSAAACTPGLCVDSYSMQPFTDDAQAINIGCEEDIQALYAAYPVARELRVLLQEIFEG